MNATYEIAYPASVISVTKRTIVENGGDGRDGSIFEGIGRLEICQENQWVP